MQVYVHLRANGESTVLYTLKFEFSVEARFEDVTKFVSAELEKLNDGNKLYIIQKIHSNPHAIIGLAPKRFVSSFVPNGGDLYCDLKIEVDLHRHVRPIQAAQVPQQEETKAGPQREIVTKTDLTFTTLSAYSYYESGKFVKVLVTFPGILDIPKEKIKITFTKRSLEVLVMDVIGKNYVFRVPRLQCKIQNEKSTYSFKKDTIVLSLMKEKEDDHWWSLFRSLGVCEVDKDE